MRLDPLSPSVNAFFDEQMRREELELLGRTPSRTPSRSITTASTPAGGGWLPGGSRDASDEC